jgi:hypothetical protein
MTVRASYADVLAAARAAVADYIPEHGPSLALWRARWDVARYLGFEDTDDQTIYMPSAFLGQVARALDALAGAGDLVKVGRNQPHPGGGSRSNSPSYYTPASYREADEGATARRAAEGAVQARWERIHADLLARGYVDLSDPAGPVHLDVMQWERMLGITG